MHIAVYEQFVLELFYNGFTTSFELGGQNNATRRIRINTDTAMDIIIDDFDYEDLYCRFIGHTEFEELNFIFDCNNFNKFVDKLKDAINKSNSLYPSYHMDITEFTSLKG